MQKWFSVLGVMLAILVAIPGHAYSRGGGGNRGGDNSTPTPKPSPTPTPEVSPVQGTIVSITPFAVSIKVTPASMPQTYKVGNQSNITLNGQPVGVADLKPGMIVTIKPAADRIYAETITASIPVATTADPGSFTTISAPQRPSAPSTSSNSGGGGYSPFGQRNFP